MWRTGYPPSLTLPRPIRSRFLSLPPGSCSFFPSFFAVCSFESCILSSPRPPTACSPARSYAHLHAPRVTYTDKMAHTVPVVQIAGNCSPRRGLSSSAFVEGRKGEGPGRSLVESVWNCEFYDLQTRSFIRVYGSTGRNEASWDPPLWPPRTNREIIARHGRTIYSRDLRFRPVPRAGDGEKFATISIQSRLINGWMWICTFTTWSPRILNFRNFKKEFFYT